MGPSRKLQKLILFVVGGVFFLILTWRSGLNFNQERMMFFPEVLSEDFQFRFP